MSTDNRAVFRALVGDRVDKDGVSTFIDHGTVTHIEGREMVRVHRCFVERTAEWLDSAEEARGRMAQKIEELSAILARQAERIRAEVQA